MMANHSIQSNIVGMVEDEGKATTLNEAQRFQLVLEDICEIGNDEERAAAALLLSRVNAAIMAIAGETVEA